MSYKGQRPSPLIAPVRNETSGKGTGYLTGSKQNWTAELHLADAGLKLQKQVSLGLGHHLDPLPTLVFFTPYPSALDSLFLKERRLRLAGTWPLRSLGCCYCALVPAAELLLLRIWCVYVAILLPL